MYLQIYFSPKFLFLINTLPYATWNSLSSLKLLMQIHMYTFKLFSVPVTTHLLPLPLYNPIYPVKAVTYADNYRCVANYLLAHATTPTSTKFT